MGKTCGSCYNFTMHYLKHKGRFFEAGVGHCKYPLANYKAENCPVCDCYIKRMPSQKDCIHIVYMRDSGGNKNEHK